MRAQFEPLLQPLTIKGLTLRNRILSTSHASRFAEDGKPKERYQLYHEAKAKGGIALTMFGGASSVSPDSSAAAWSQISVADDGVIPCFKQFAKRIHAHGAALMCQITHLGRRTRYDIGDWLPAVSPSAIRESHSRSTGKVIEDTDIERIVRDFGQAARRCKAGALDGCEIMAASQHLIDQFWTPLVNKRTDGYGGSLNNRMRFGFEVLEEVRNQVGDDYVVGMRMSSGEMIDGGLSPAECIEIAKAYSSSGLIDFLNVMPGQLGDAISYATYLPNMITPPAPFLALASAIKAEVRIPVFHATRITTLDTAREAIVGGHVDMVGLTRALFADPYIVEKTLEGRAEEVVPCVGASFCLSGRGALCIHNAATGREAIMPHKIQPASKRRAIAVVGGGIAGLEAARVCAERGHRVTLFEKSGSLGGQVKIAAMATWRHPLSEIVDWRSREMRRLEVDMRLGVFADAAAIQAIEPEVVIVATGANPQIQELAVNTWDILEARSAPGRNVLLVDEMGCEQALSCADFMAARGSSITFVTSDKSPGEEVDRANLPIFLRELYAKGVCFRANERLIGIQQRNNSIEATFANTMTSQRSTLMIDQVVVERGVVPNDGLYFELKPLSKNNGDVDLDALLTGEAQNRLQNPAGRFQLFRIGDAVVGRTIHAAVYDALRLCKEL
ncbi:MAG: FAD-dependent oxidoreductase [Pseudorhodoplanes sp.]